MYVKRVLVKISDLGWEERELETTDLVITVADKPVALAGVMGGEATEISENLVVLSLKLLSSMANHP